MIWWAMFGNGTKIGVITENNTGCYEEVLGTLTAIRIIAGIANPDSAGVKIVRNRLTLLIIVSTLNLTISQQKHITPKQYIKHRSHLNISIFMN